MGEKSTPARTPARTPSTAKKAPSTGKQQSILGFFSKPGAGPSPSTKPASTSKKDASPQCLKETTRANSMLARRTTAVTPVPSSDAIEPGSSQENRDTSIVKVNKAGVHLLAITVG